MTFGLEMARIGANGTNRWAKTNRKITLKRGRASQIFCHVRPLLRINWLDNHVPTIILKSPRFVQFGVDLAQYEAKSEIAGVNPSCLFNGRLSG